MANIIYNQIKYYAVDRSGERILITYYNEHRQLIGKCTVASEWELKSSLQTVQESVDELSLLDVRVLSCVKWNVLNKQSNDFLKRNIKTKIIW